MKNMLKSQQKTPRYIGDKRKQILIDIAVCNSSGIIANCYSILGRGNNSLFCFAFANMQEKNCQVSGPAGSIIP